MRLWSPAYLINECIMFYFEGCIFSHVYLLFWVTLLITQVHKLVVKSVYCYEYSSWVFQESIYSGSSNKHNFNSWITGPGVQMLHLLWKTLFGQFLVLDVNGWLFLKLYFSVFQFVTSKLSLSPSLRHRCTLLTIMYGMENSIPVQFKLFPQPPAETIQSGKYDATQVPLKTQPWWLISAIFRRESWQPLHGEMEE